MRRISYVNDGNLYDAITCVEGYNKLSKSDHDFIESEISSTKDALERLRGRAIGFIINATSEIENGILDSSLIEEGLQSEYIMHPEDPFYFRDLSCVFDKMSSIASGMQSVCDLLEDKKLNDIMNFVKKQIEEADENS